MFSGYPYKSSMLQVYFIKYIFTYIIYILLCFVTYFALSTERTCPDLHFTTDYILYNWVCDE